MPAVVEPARGFTLADMERPSQPEEKPAAPLQTETPAEPQKSTTLEHPEAPEKEPETPARPESEPTDTAKTLPAPQKTLGELMDAAPADRQAQEEKDAADKKAAEDAAAAEKAKTEPAKLPETRDADLKIEHGAHVHPSTRKRFDIVTGLAKAARDERDAIAAERDAIKKERDELAEKAKGVALPKETVEELKTLRERVRELAIEKDPAIQAKYDSRMEANNKTIIETLKAWGFGTIKGENGKETENPAAIQQLVREGLTYDNLQEYIDKLKGAGLHSDARKIERAIEKNELLAEEKQVEIDQWKGNYTERQMQRDAEAKRQQEERNRDFRVQTETQLKSDLEQLAKDFSYINRPPEPLATDVPATRKAKEAAIADFDAAAKRIQDEVRTLTVDGVPPEKQAQVVGKLNAAAIAGVVIRNQVLPRVLKDISAKDARIKELETELGKIRGAGRLSNLQSATNGEAPYRGEAKPQSLEDAFTNRVGVSQ